MEDGITSDSGWLVRHSQKPQTYSSRPEQMTNKPIIESMDWLHLNLPMHLVDLGSTTVVLLHTNKELPLMVCHLNMTVYRCLIIIRTLQWSPALWTPLNLGHLSNEDSAYCPSYVHRYVEKWKSTSEIRTPL